MDQPLRTAPSPSVKRRMFCQNTTRDRADGASAASGPDLTQRTRVLERSKVSSHRAVEGVGRFSNTTDFHNELVSVRKHCTRQLSASDGGAQVVPNAIRLATPGL
jgi:hypothetical protein